MKTILEITYNSPAEVFIHRHVASLYKNDYPVRFLARQALKNHSGSASTQKTGDCKTDLDVLPKFGFISFPNVIAIGKRLFIRKSSSAVKGFFRDQVFLEFIKRLHPDLIHFHFGNLAGLMYWLPQELGVPYTLSLRGSDIRIIPLRSPEREKQIRDGLNYAAGIHTVSENLWSVAEPYLNHEVFHKTIYTTVPIRKKLVTQESHDEVRFTTIGRLHWSKNYVDLLKAFKQLLDIDFDAKLIIVGDGPEKESLIYWVLVLGLQNKVEFTGALNYERIKEVLTHSTGYIQSSIAEGFSNATAEAMALGIPVFATDVGGTGEIIKDGFNGFLLDPLDPNNWHKKLRIVRDKQLMRNIRTAALQTAKENFSESTHANAFIHFYTHVLNGHN